MIRLALNAVRQITMSSRARKTVGKYSYGETVTGKGTSWYQTTVTIPPKPRGIHVITDILQGRYNGMVLLLLVTNEGRKETLNNSTDQSRISAIMVKS